MPRGGGKPSPFAGTIVQRLGLFVGRHLRQCLVGTAQRRGLFPALFGRLEVVARACAGGQSCFSRLTRLVGSFPHDASEKIQSDLMLWIAAARAERVFDRALCIAVLILLPCQPEIDRGIGSGGSYGLSGGLGGVAETLNRALSIDGIAQGGSLCHFSRRVLKR